MVKFMVKLVFYDYFFVFCFWFMVEFRDYGYVFYLMFSFGLLVKFRN
jgi:hypothetical protein